MPTLSQHFPATGLNRSGMEARVDWFNLASHVLGLLLRLLPQDFDRCYGYAPWLVETFVDPSLP